MPIDYSIIDSLITWGIRWVIVSYFIFHTPYFVLSVRHRHRRRRSELYSLTISLLEVGECVSFNFWSLTHFLSLFFDRDRDGNLKIYKKSKDDKNLQFCPKWRALYTLTQYDWMCRNRRTLSLSLWQKNNGQ